MTSCPSQYKGFPISYATSAEGSPASYPSWRTFQDWSGLSGGLGAPCGSGSAVRHVEASLGMTLQGQALLQATSFLLCCAFSGPVRNHGISSPGVSFPFSRCRFPVKAGGMEVGAGSEATGVSTSLWGPMKIWGLMPKQGLCSIISFFCRSCGTCLLACLIYLFIYFPSQDLQW